jgi:putative NADH-flavin reductase
MKLAIFGATGKTGRHLVQQGLEKGHEVTVLVRDPAKLGLQNPKLRVVKGDVLSDAAAVEQTVSGADAVLVVLGATSLKKPTNLMTDGTRAVMEGMKKTGARRLLVISTVGAHETRQQAGFVFDRILRPLIRTLAPAAHHIIFIDKERMEEAVRQTDLDWTLVRAPRLVEGPFTGKWRTVMPGEPGLSTRSMSFADVAGYMLQAAEDPKLVKTAPIAQPA